MVYDYEYTRMESVRDKVEGRGKVTAHPNVQWDKAIKTMKEQRKQQNRFNKRIWNKLTNSLIDISRAARSIYEIRLEHGQDNVPDALYQLRRSKDILHGLLEQLETIEDMICNKPL